MANQTGPGNVDLEQRTKPKGKQAMTASPDSNGQESYGDESPIVHPNRSRVFSQSSPLNPNEMTLDALTIGNGQPRFPRGGPTHYGSPPYQGNKHSYNSGAYGFSPPGPNRKDSLNTHSSYGGRNHFGAQRKGNTWMSPDEQINQDFLTVRNSMRRLFKTSEVAKWKLNDYIGHREAMLASEANKLARQVKNKEEEPSFTIDPISSELGETLRKWGVPGTFAEEGNLGHVLGEPTIWCTDWENGKDDVAPWPTIAEMKWEGDDRAKTGVGRFLPLPREQGPHNLQWNQLPIIEQYPIDQVAKIPTMEDVYLPVDQDIEPEYEYLWSKKLEEEMDEFLAS